LYPVLVTLIPRCCAAATSIDALRAPVEAISLSCGSRSMMSRGSGVLSRMTQTTSNGRSLSTSAPIGDVVIEDRDLSPIGENGPIRHCQSDILIIIQDRDLCHAACSKLLVFGTSVTPPGRTSSTLVRSDRPFLRERA
jgi:hypothetical protein